MNTPTNADVTPPPRSRSGPVAVALLVLGILSAGTVAFSIAVRAGLDRREERLALTPDERMEGLRIPEFAMVDQAGQPVTREIFRGRLTVVDFMFTNCPFICPMLTARMRSLQDSLGGLPGFRLVSVSVDPENDTPEVLAAYAETHGADPAVWTFLTGPSGEAKRISEEGLRLGLTEDPSRPITLGDGRVMNNINHTGKLTLIGPDGSALGMFSANDPAEVAALEARVRVAARRLGSSASVP